MSKATLTVEGFVAKDPEIRSTPQGRQVVNVSVPHTPRRKNQQTGQYEDAGATLWVQADFWDDMAQAIAASVTKGTLVTITGTPELREYQKQDGTTGVNLNLRFGTLAVIPRGSGQQAQGAPNTGGTGNYAAPGANGAQAGAQAWGGDDDTPF